ncbi:MAG: MFS transporter [Candidatus Omnitrophica bacterium]|nr:MFS transporter [Candidatus Omnitrophota bacterium]
MFSSLKVRNFRIYWIGMLLSLVGTWIQMVAQSWLVFDLSHSSFLLGLVGFISTFPIFLLSLAGGIVADRVNKRKIMLFTQHAFMFLAFVLAALTQFKLVRVSHIIFIALLNGIVMSFDAPARQAVVVELVGKEHLLNAIALNSAAFNSARIIGPALAGIFIASIGMSGCFYINGFSFLSVIIALLWIKIPDINRPAVKNTFRKDLGETFSFIKDNRTLVILIAMVGVTSLFGISYVILMPVFAQDILRVGSKGLGILMSSAGAGALSGALMLAALGDFKHKGRLLFVASLVLSLSLILFSLSRTYIFSLIILAVVGWASITITALINTILQVLSPDKFRGRLMSIFMLTFAGLWPFGNLLAGVFSHFWGAPFAVLFGGVVCSLFFAGINTAFAHIRKIQ